MMALIKLLMMKMIIREENINPTRQNPARGETPRNISRIAMIVIPKRRIQIMLM